MSSKFDLRIENSLRDIDELSLRLYSPNNSAKFANKVGLLEQYRVIKGTCGFINAYVVGSDGKPTIEQLVVYR